MIRALLTVFGRNGGSGVNPAQRFGLVQLGEFPRRLRMKCVCLRRLQRAIGVRVKRNLMLFGRELASTRKASSMACATRGSSSS